MYEKEMNAEEIDEMLPFDEMTESKKTELSDLIHRFFIEETALIEKKEEKLLKVKPYLSDPRVLARLLCGIQSIKYPYQEWKKTILWGAAKRLKYENVRETVLEILAARKEEKSL
jgi:hypothetical protein